jgi:hypothetical protein
MRRRAINRKNWLYISLLLALVASLVLLFCTYKRLSTYRVVERLQNQACIGLGKGAITFKPVDIKAKFNLPDSNPEGKTVEFTCLTNQSTEKATIHGKEIAAYEFGAYATYFKDNAAATKFAEQKVNSLRFWGVDQAGQQAGIPQTSLFTFIVSDVPAPYYDAYTVKDNALVRISLPCGDNDVSRGGVACYAEAESSLNTFADSIETLEL